MFSTVDSPGARFLRVYLINGNEEIPILIPKSMQSMAREIQTIPTHDRLLNLANNVARGTWVPYRLTPADQHYHNLISGGQTFPLLDFNLDPPYSIDFTGDEVVTDMNYSLYTKGYISFEKLNLFRIIEEDEPPPAPGEAVEFQSIRAELWRYKFDAGSARLRAIKFLEITVNKPASTITDFQTSQNRSLRQ
jgi:hypothetical protein